MSLSTIHLILAITVSCAILVVYVESQRIKPSVQRGHLNLSHSRQRRQKEKSPPPGQKKKQSGGQPPGLVAKKPQAGAGGGPAQPPGLVAKPKQPPGLAKKQTPPGLAKKPQSDAGVRLGPPGSWSSFANSYGRPPYGSHVSSFSPNFNNRYPPPPSFHRPPRPPRPPQSYGGQPYTSQFPTYHTHTNAYVTQFRPYFHSQGHQFHHPRRPKHGRYRDFTEIFKELDSKVEANFNGTAEEDAINDDFNGRSIVLPGQYPHMAALGFEANLDPVDFKCGGSLISDSFVLTAAHCCHLNGESPILVKIGDIKLKEREQDVRPQRRRVKQVFIHPDYNESYYYNDIALLELDRPVEYTQFVRPIRLWARNEIPYEKVYTMGYGATSFAQAPTNILTELDMTIVDTDKCNSTMPPEENAPSGILDSQICAKDYERNRDTCQGDSGGPMQLNLQRRNKRRLRYYLVGITSYGTFCRSPYPGVYTRVSWYVDWIASIVWPEHFQNFSNEL